MRGEAVTPYVYDMVLKEKGRIRRDPTYVARRGRHGNLSEQVREFHGQPSVGSTFSEAAYPWQPGDTLASSTDVPDARRGAGPHGVPARRPRHPLDFATSTPETRYNSMFPRDPVLGMLLTDGEGARTYAAGERVHKPAGAAPVTAGPNPAAPFERSGDRMRVVVSGFLDADGNHGMSRTDDSGMSTHLEIRADDEVVGRDDCDAAGHRRTAAGRVAGEHLVHRRQPPVVDPAVDLHRDGVDVRLGARAGRPGGRPARDRHRLRRRRRPAQPDPQPALPAGAPHLDDSRAPIDVTVDASYDDGETWKRARLSGQRVTLPRGDGFVSLRVRAHDDAGSELYQRIIRAWYLR